MAGCSTSESQSFPSMRTSLSYTTLGATLGAALCAVLALPPQAQSRDHGSQGGGRDHGGGYDFHGRDFHRFTPGERHTWEGGNWVHGWHDNRFAWWWTTGGGWYFYPTPVYPYPTYVPPAIVVQQAPPLPTGLPPAQFWYYCDNPMGYYPYVASCNAPWRQVPATPGR